MGFKALTINTDSAAEPHIFAQDDAAIYRALSGQKNGIAAETKGAIATKSGETTIRIGPCVIFVCGHAGRIQTGDSEELDIAPGAAGRERIDLIVAELKRSGAVDSLKLRVIQGESSADTATAPKLTQDDMDKAGTLYQLALYKVKMTGTLMSAPELLAPILVNPSGGVKKDDLASNAPDKGASMIGIQDSTNKINASTVEGALAEINAKADNSLPLSGGKMSGAIDMSVNKIRNLAGPDDERDGANKAYVDSQIVKCTPNGTALPLSGGTMTGSIDMSVYKIRNLAGPDDIRDGANKAYVDSQIAKCTPSGTALPLSGGKMSGVIDMGVNKIRNLAGPDDIRDATTKGYVDGKIRGGTGTPNTSTCPNGCIYVQY